MHARTRLPARGLTLPELLASTTVMMLAVALTYPTIAERVGAVRTAAAARLLMVHLNGLRSRSIARAVTHGLLFERDRAGWFWREVRDGNGNGLRTTEVRDGTDPFVSAPRRLEDLVAGVDLGFPEGHPIPRIPPDVGWLRDLDRPLRLGNTKLLSFSPLGTSSSGTIFVSDGKKQLTAVVLYGRTGRVRLWHLDVEEARWRL